MSRRIQSISALTKALALGLGVFCLFFSHGASAGPRATPSSTWEESLIKGNIIVSEWFDGMAEGVDVFIAGKKVTDRVNQSNVRISNRTYFVEGQKETNETNLEVNVRLPNVEDYWQLKFSDTDETQERGVRNTYLRQQPRAKNYGATVGLFKKLGNIRAAFQPRVALKDPLEVSHSLAFESVAEVEDSYKVNPKLEFFANPNEGTGIFHALNFNFQLSRVYDLSLINEGQYLDKTHVYSATNGISLGQVFTKNSSIGYSFFTGSNNRENYHLDSYGISVTYSHLIYKSILDYSITPQLDFTRDRSFAALPGLNFNVGLNF
ncbi:MAG: hypothetical protein ACK5P7_12380 [Bdellovibrio sp.]